MNVSPDSRLIWPIALVIFLFMPSRTLAQPSEVPAEYKKFIYRVDQRGAIEKFANSWHVPLKPAGRSFALIAGVIQYPNLDIAHRTLKEAAWDIDNLVNY